MPTNDEQDEPRHPLADRRTLKHHPRWHYEKGCNYLAVGGCAIGNIITDLGISPHQRFQAYTYPSFSGAHFCIGKYPDKETAQRAVEDAVLEPAPVAPTQEKIGRQQDAMHADVEALHANIAKRLTFLEAAHGDHVRETAATLEEVDRRVSNVGHEVEAVRASQRQLVQDTLGRVAAVEHRMTKIEHTPVVPFHRDLHPTPAGCVCPPGAEKTCGGLGCPRRGYPPGTQSVSTATWPGQASQNSPVGEFREVTPEWLQAVAKKHGINL